MGYSPFRLYIRFIFCNNMGNFSHIDFVILYSVNNGKKKKMKLQKPLNFINYINLSNHMMTKTI